MIKFYNISKTYPKSIASPACQALCEVSFDLQQGETVGLIGANGAGKSTCIKILMDFIRPNEGRVLLFGQTPAVVNNRLRIGYLPEVTNFYPFLNIQNFINFTGSMGGKSTKQIKENSERLLHQLGLWEARKKPLKSYSKGMQQRASFVLALLNDPELFILDEPMSGLDPVGREQISNLILDLKKQGKTILFCSHLLDDVDRLVDKVIVLDKGQKKFGGSTQQLNSMVQGESVQDSFLKLVMQEQNP